MSITFRDIVKMLSERKLQKLRAIVAHLVIDPQKCFLYDALLCRLIPDLVYITKNGWKCMKCKKFFSSYEKVYRHLVQEHKYDLEKTVFLYICEKYRYIGLLNECVEVEK